MQNKALKSIFSLLYFQNFFNVSGIPTHKKLQYLTPGFSRTIIL